MIDWTHNTIWFDKLNNSDFKHLSFKKNGNLSTKAEYVIIDDFKPKTKDLNELEKLSNPKYLEINRSNVCSLNGIAKIGKLKRLELHYCTKLESCEGIELLADSIEWLHINSCKKFTLSKELLMLKKLKVLCLNACGPIENLGFLKNFPELIAFRFVNTNIVDGDLKPLYQHPNLKDVSFNNKRHYNLKDSDVNQYFASRQERKKVVSNGDFSTFRYTVFS